MSEHRNCIIDNWSLEQASLLLSENFHDISHFTEEQFINKLGGLSNYINAILLYDTPKYVANGFEEEWQSQLWFEKNSSLYFQKIDPENAIIDWNNEESYKDRGVKNYLLMSEYHKSDLFVSAQRATEILKHKAPKVDDNFISALNKIDEKLKKETEDIWLPETKIGINKNFLFPSLTQYVLSEATSQKDLLTVIMQIKSSGQIDELRRNINEASKSAKGALKFQKQVDYLIAKSLGKEVKSENSISFKVNVLFLTITKNINPNYFKPKRHLILLKDIIACRTESEKIKKDIERIFKKKISL